MPSTLLSSELYHLQPSDRFTELTDKAEAYFQAEAMRADQLRRELADGRPREYDVVTLLSRPEEDDEVVLGQGMARMQLQSAPEYARQPHIFKTRVTRAEGRIALESAGIIHVDPETNIWNPIGMHALFRYDMPTPGNKHPIGMYAYHGYVVAPGSVTRYEK